MNVLYGSLLIGGVLVLLSIRKQTKRNRVLEIPPKWHPFLLKQVRFYRELDETRQPDFLAQVARFLDNVPIHGVAVNVTYEDRLLVASSAVITLFGFNGWEYTYLDEVILYPSAFDRNFNFHTPQELIIGMVGSGPMEGKMILSQPALHQGFDNNSDKQNVGLHEFIHLYDKEDGAIDGLPLAFMDNWVLDTWIDLVRKKMDDIHAGESDIRDYGGLNTKEFFTVASEYFFERPHLLKKNHPELYDMLSDVFNQDMTTHLSIKEEVLKPIGRNSPCPCGSGLKYKKCCLN